MLTLLKQIIFEEIMKEVPLKMQSKLEEKAAFLFKAPSPREKIEINFQRAKFTCTILECGSFMRIDKSMSKDISRLCNRCLKSIEKGVVFVPKADGENDCSSSSHSRFPKLCYSFTIGDRGGVQFASNQKWKDSKVRSLHPRRCRLIHQIPVPLQRTRS